MGISIPGRIYLKLRGLAATAGYDVQIKRKRTTKGPSVPKGKAFSPITTPATYSPWLADKEFLSIREKVKDHTMVDVLRLYELWQLVDESRKLSGAIIEVGAWRGGSGAVMARRAQLSGIKEAVYVCDTFKGVVKAGKKDTYYKGGEHFDTSATIVRALMKKNGLGNARVLEGTFPDETGHLVKEKTIRLCHIDVDVYQGSKDIVRWLWPRLCIGGMIIYDDYGFQTAQGVTAFVEEERTRSDRIVIYNLNGHAIVVKTR
ncbi:MAG: TylF/MycF/NovP-related O-methyltransferase [Nanoarchaeota archaeon]